MPRLPASSAFTRARRYLTQGALVVALLTLLAGVGGVLRPSPAHAIARDGLPPQGDGTPPLSFQGGWVQYHPKVYFVFWGDKWNTDSTHQSVKARLEQVFQDLAGSQYNNVLTQYGNQTGDPNGHVHNDVQWMGSLVDPRVPQANVDLITDVSAEAQWGFDQFHLSADKNIQVLVFPQQGTTYFTLFGSIDYCGAHYYTDTNTLAYGEVRYASDLSNCHFTGSVSGVVEDVTWTAVHEYAEIATDPHLFTSDYPYLHAAGSGWNTGTPVFPPPGFWTPKEVADVCEDYYVGASTPNNPSPFPSYMGFYLPYLWRNWSGAFDNNKGCIQHAGEDFSSPDTTLPFRGKHTVQGGILDKYHETGNQGPFITLLGAPLTEETPVSGGVASYFAGQVCNGGYVISSSSQDGGKGLTSGSAIYSSGAGIHEVHGCIYQKYTAMGGPSGALGFPVSDEYATPAGRESDFQRGSITADAAGIQVHIGDGKPAVALNNKDGRLETFKWGSDGALWHDWQTSANGSWSGWYSLGGTLASPPVVRANDDWRLEVFARGTDSSLYHKWQTAPGGGWSGWASLGGAFRGDPVVGWNVDGRLEVFVRGTDDALWHNWQLSRGSSSWSGWYSLGGTLTSSPTVETNVNDGRLEVFARWVDGSLRHDWQTSAGGGWSGWASLGGTLTSDPTVKHNYDGRLEVFARETDGALWHNWQTARGGPGWSGWNSLGGGVVGAPAVGLNILDGRLEAFVRGTDAALHHKWQTVTGSSSWSQWDHLGGTLTSDPTVGANQDGRLEAFVRGTDGAIWHNWQTAPGSSNWYGWNRL